MALVRFYENIESRWQADEMLLKPTLCNEKHMPRQPWSWGSITKMCAQIDFQINNLTEHNFAFIKDMSLLLLYV